MSWQTISPEIMRFLRDTSGVTAIEYTLIASLLAAAIIGGMNLVGDSLLLHYQSAAEAFPDAGEATSSAK